MWPFKKKNDENLDQKQKDQRKLYDLNSLEDKAKRKEAMTVDEYDALQRGRQRNVINAILRVLGVFVLLVLVVMAIGSFLYPYSLFNVIGFGNMFPDCVSRIQYYVNGVWQSYGELCTAFGSGQLSDGYGIFVVISGWTIVPLATIGIISAIIFAAYVIAYSIRDIIDVFKNLNKQISVTVTDVVSATGESIDASFDNQKKGAKKKSTKKKEEKKLFTDKEQEEIIDQIEKSFEEEKNAARRNENDTEASPELSTEDLDRLLSGESLEDNTPIEQ